MLRHGAERRPGLDRLQLLGIADQNDLGARPLGRADERGELPRRDHAGLVDHQYVALPEFPSPVIPTVLP